MMLPVWLRQEANARLEAQLAALWAELAEARRTAQAAAAAPAAPGATRAGRAFPCLSKAERGAGLAERSAGSWLHDGNDARSDAVCSEQVSLMDEEDVAVGDSAAAKPDNMEPTEAWSPGEGGGGSGAWEDLADELSGGKPGGGEPEPAGCGAVPRSGAAGSAGEAELMEEEDSDLTRPGDDSDAEAGASPPSANAGNCTTAAPGRHPNPGSAGFGAPTRGFALAVGAASGGTQRPAHSRAPEPWPAGKENRGAAAPTATGRPRLPKRQLTSLYVGDDEAACEAEHAERAGTSVLGASGARIAPGLNGVPNPFLRRGTAHADCGAPEFAGMLAECGLVEGLPQVTLPPMRVVRPGRPAASLVNPPRVTELIGSLADFLCCGSAPHKRPISRCLHPWTAAHAGQRRRAATCAAWLQVLRRRRADCVCRLPGTAGRACRRAQLPAEGRGARQGGGRQRHARAPRRRRARRDRQGAAPGRRRAAGLPCLVLHELSCLSTTTCLRVVIA